MPSKPAQQEMLRSTLRLTARTVPQLLAALVMSACGTAAPASSGSAPAPASQSSAAKPTTSAPAASAATSAPATASKPAASPASSASPAAKPAGSASGAAAPSPPASVLAVPEGQMANQALKPVQVAGHNVNLPPGFSMSVLAQGLKVPRFMAFDSAGNLAVAEDSANQVTLFAAQNGQVSGQGKTLIGGLDDPTSVAFSEDSIYVAEQRQISKYKYSNGNATGRQVVIPNLPVGTDHHTRTIVFGPDGTLYLAMGSPCDVCTPNDPRYATVGRYNADGSGYQLFAKGLRNAVGLAMQPNSNALWATVMGRDNLGDDTPWDLLTILRQGADYGWPRCYNDRQKDPQFGTAAGCGDITLPEVGLQAHSAPLGLAFYTGDKFPAEYRGDIFIGLHGSWNRSATVGYKVVRAHFDSGRIASVTDFATGWRAPGPGQVVQTPYGVGSSGAWGRPVDPVVGPDGSLYLSDDYLGAIYKISYSG